MDCSYHQKKFQPIRSQKKLLGYSQKTHCEADFAALIRALAMLIETFL